MLLKLFPILLSLGRTLKHFYFRHNFNLSLKNLKWAWLNRHDSPFRPIRRVGLGVLLGLEQLAGFSGPNGFVGGKD